MAQYMAGHADPRTTKLYDRRRQQVTRGEVERIRYEKKQAGPSALLGHRPGSLTEEAWLGLCPTRHEVARSACNS